MSADGSTGRASQKLRTRKDLLRAASRLMRGGHRPSLDEVAAEALVSRATAYRFFSGIDQLMVEASLDIEVPEPDDLFRGGPAQDPVARLERVDTMMNEMIQANEASIRTMLVNSLQRPPARAPRARRRARVNAGATALRRRGSNNRRMRGRQTRGANR